jgi:hypothetical protein
MTAIPAEEFQVVECPRCGAPPGQPCVWRIRRPLGHTHLDRVKLADAERRKAG